MALTKFFRIALALAAAGCGGSTGAPADPTTAGDGGTPDAGPGPCLDEWVYSEPSRGMGRAGMLMHVLGGETLIASLDPANALQPDGSHGVKRIVNRCGAREVGPDEELAVRYYFDERAVLRGAFVAGLDVWNGIALPSPQPAGAVVEYREDGSLFGVRNMSYTDAVNTIYPWGGRLEVSGSVDEAGSTPRFRLVDLEGHVRWSIETPTVPLSKGVGTGALPFNADFAIGAFSAPDSAATPSARTRFDAVSRDGQLLWQHVELRWGTGSELDVGPGGDVTLLTWSPTGDGRELVRLDASGAERWRTTISDQAFSDGGYFTLSTSPRGRAMVGTTAYRGARLCGKFTPGPGGLDASADGSALQGIVLGLNADGTCAFVRKLDGDLHLSSIVGAKFVSDDDVRILWDDSLVPANDLSARSVRKLERVKWDTLVAKYGVANP